MADRKLQLKLANVISECLLSHENEAHLKIGSTEAKLTTVILTWLNRQALEGLSCEWGDSVVGKEDRSNTRTRDWSLS